MTNMESSMSLLSDDDVDAIACFDITETLDLHDSKFGCAGSAEFTCPTCNARSDICMGHHASLSLGVSMFHPLIHKDAERIINNTCFQCLYKFEKLYKSKTIKCSKCGFINYCDYTISTKDPRLAVRPNNRDTRSADKMPEGLLPGGYVLSKILVPPIHLRNTEDMEWSSYIQRLYENLVKLISSRKKDTKLNICLMYSKIISTSQAQKKQDCLIGIMSGKDGIFRKLMLGKRVESCARAVVVGDPNIMLDEVAVPKDISKSIKVDVTCTKHNISLLKDLAKNNKLWWKGTDDNVDAIHVLRGINFHRDLQDGDLVLLNRQPSLSRFSLMCFRVKIRTDNYKVLAINPQVTSPFNADFDGDEMNIFFSSENAEMSELCHLSKCVTMEEKDNLAVLQPVQDVVTGCYIMSRHNEPVSKEIWSDCMLYCSPVLKELEMNTHGLLSMCIPSYDGRLLNKAELTRIVCNRNSKEVLTILHKLQFVSERWIQAYGLTVSIKSVHATPVVKQHGENNDSFQERCIQTVKHELSGTGMMNMIDSGAKGSLIHASHMAVAIGQQYIQGREGIFCSKSYSEGLTPDEFFGHQMAAREGVVSTGVGTANTGYLNRRACKILADLKVQYNGTIADSFGISSFHSTLRDIIRHD